MTGPYSVSERVARQVPDGDQWRDEMVYVVIHGISGREVIHETREREQAAKWCRWLNEAWEGGYVGCYTQLTTADILALPDSPQHGGTR